MKMSEVKYFFHKSDRNVIIMRHKFKYKNVLNPLEIQEDFSVFRSIFIDSFRILISH